MTDTQAVKSSHIIRFVTKDRARLSGILFRNPRGSKTCVVFLHGMTSSFINNLSMALASGLDENIGLFSLNTRGHDCISSIAKVVKGKRRDIIAGTYFEKFEDSLYDLRGAIDMLSKRGFSRFVLCGHSTGCQKALYYQYKTQDRRVAGLVLLGPADDYNGYRKEFGKNFGKVLAKCRRLIKEGKGNTQLPEASWFSASRMVSLIDQKNVESRLLDYNGKLAEFSKIKIPILAVFGSEEEHRLMPVEKYLEILDAKSNSRRYSGLVIYGANHGFYWKEGELVKEINTWLSSIR